MLILASLSIQYLKAFAVNLIENHKKRLIFIQVILCQFKIPPKGL